MHSDPLISIRGDRAKIPIGLRILGRYFFTGATLRGPGDNATMWHRATVDYRARPYIRLTAPIWQRLARRHAAITTPAGLLLAAPWIRLWPVLLYLTLLTIGSTVWVIYRAVSHFRNGKLNARYIDPAARTLYAIMSVRYDKRAARQHVQIPPEWTPSDDQAIVRVVLPSDKPLTATQERALVRSVGGRLGIVDAKGAWTRAAERVFVDISGTPLPPPVVTLDSLKRAVEAATLTRPIVGADANGAVAIDYEQDSPHVAISGPAGTGKSTLMRFITAQRMSHGVGVIMLDAKRWSHKWMHDLPEDRVRYAYRIPDIHAALVAVGEELKRRIECDRSELGTFREVDVYVEEANSLIKLLTAHWRGERKRIINAAKLAMAEEMDFDEADLDPPTLSPAVAALQYGVNMGRELQIHFHVAAQRLEANVFGSNSGGAVRQSFQLRFMAQWDRALWKMLANAVDYVAWPGGPRGLWGFVQDTEFRIVRVPMMSEDEAITMATSSPVSGPVLGQRFAGGPVMEGTRARTVTAGVKLSDAVSLLPAAPDGSRLTLEGLRSAAKRPGFPVPVGQEGTAKLYDIGALIYWREGQRGIVA